MTTLYLKYRPQKISELDLTAVRESLEKLLTSKTLPHALLFSGPRGSGKTSAARILAKAINCEKNDKKLAEPCNRCSHCKATTTGSNLDVIEIDTASHRGIDDIRALREAVSLAPASARKKVYVLDEAHMLTTEAANAFLKTLEEPPVHAMFILATTNPEKLPDTVLSRLTAINFTKATSLEIARQIKRVAKGENIKIEPDAVDLITKISDGSFRDSIKILENLAINKRSIKLKDVETLTLGAGNATTKAFIEILSNQSAKEALDEIEKLASLGISLKTFTLDLIDLLHKDLLAKQGLDYEEVSSIPTDDLIYLIELLNHAMERSKYYPAPHIAIQIALVKFFKKKAPVTKVSQETEPEPVVVPQKTTSKPPEELSEAIWNKILTDVRSKDAKIQALLKASKPLSFDGQTVMLGVYYQFHKERLETTKNMMALENTFSQIMATPIKIACTLTDRPQDFGNKPDKNVSDEVGEDIIAAAEEIFN